MKICKKCKTEKPKDEFSKHRAKNDGLQPRCKDCTREHRAKTAKSISEYQKSYRILKPGERSRQQIEYATRNPEKISQQACINRRNRRARKRDADGRHTFAQIQAIFQSQKGLCAGCSIELCVEGNNKYHVDHIMPLALGGSNWPENLQCLCPKCNLSKGAKHPEIWAKDIGLILNQTTKSPR